MSGIDLVGCVIVVMLGAFVMWAAIVASEPCAFAQAGCSGDPTMEAIGAAHVMARRYGLRMGKAPNQGTRHARFAIMARAGLSADSLRYADARWSGAFGWRDLSGAWHTFPSKAPSIAPEVTYMGFPVRNLASMG